MNAPNDNKLIMVVDDDEDIRFAMSDTLEAEGYRVVLAEDGVDALAKLRALEAPPSVILLDLMMPNMDGWEFRAAQRSDPALASIPVVILSADAQVKQQAAQLGTPGMAKPVRIAELLSMIERFTAAPPAAAGPA